MPRKAHKYHYIYKTTCNVTGKYYIGMHSTSNLEDGYMGSGKILRRSLNKYGIEKHIKEIIEWLPDRASLKDREKEIVNEDLLLDSLCMNLQIGGHGGGVVNTINVKDIDGNFFRVSKNDTRFISGQLVGVNKGVKIKQKSHKHTKESKEKIRNSRLKNNIPTRIRINNGLINKRIRANNLDNWINLGWSLGTI
jgi:hypothetical protein